MNRRDFIKAVPAIAVLPAVVWAGTKDEQMLEPSQGRWPYRVNCYEREQGEWVFNTNRRGSFSSEREYTTFKEESANIGTSYKYCGFMYDGVLHFQTFDDATDFVWMHVRAKDDTNIIDTIYDVYFKNTLRKDAVEYQVAHYWFNGDTGSQIHWEADGFNRETGEGLINWNKVEAG